MKLRLVALLSLSLLAPASAVRAQPSEDEPSGHRPLAEALFQAGKQLMAEGKVDEACAKLAESQRLEPGGGTVLLLGICHESQGKWATAAAELRAALSIAKRDRRADREKLAQKHLADVEPKVSRVVFVLPPGAPADVSVVVDGTPISRKALDVPLPMDPGAHPFRVEAKGKRPYASTVTVASTAEEQRVPIPELETAPVAEAPPAASAPAAPPTDRPAAAAAPLGTQRILALAAGGAGIALLGVGTFFGVRTIALSDDARAMCDPAQCTSRDAIATNDDARSSATVANVAIVAGAAVVVTGIVLWLTAPRRELPVRTGSALRLSF